MGRTNKVLPFFCIVNVMGILMDCSLLAVMHITPTIIDTYCKKQVFDQQFSEKLISADFGKLVLHVVIDKAVMRQRAAASLLGA